MRHRRALFSTGLAALSLILACSSDSDEPPAGATSGSNGGTGGKGGSASGGRAGGGAMATGGASGEGGDGAGGDDDLGGQGGSVTSGGSGGSSASAGSGGSSASAGSGGSTPTGGTAGSAGLGEGGDGTGANGPLECDSDQDPGDPPAATGLCVPGAVWGAETPVPVDAGDSDPLIAVTPDELTIVWLASSSVLVPHYADRASVTDDFGTPIAAGVDGVVAVSPDGLRLIVQTADSTIEEATRAARGDPFGTPDGGDFTELNAALEAEALSYVGVAISPDDRTLYYSAMSREGTDFPLHVSVRTATEAWPVGEVVEGCEFEALNGFSVRPSAVSSDGLTLFYWDSLRAQARAAFRQTSNGPFVWFDDLGPRYAPQPNTACDRLYYSTDGLVYAER